MSALRSKCCASSKALLCVGIALLSMSGWAVAASQFVYVANRDSNNVSAYTVDATTGELTPVAGSPFPAAGTATHGVAVDPSGRFVYVPGASSNDVSAYTVDATTGALTPVAGSPFTADFGAFVAAVDPSGKFVYVANVNSTTVSAYAMDATSGALTPVPGSPFAAGTNPSGLAVDPSGKFLYVACFGSSDISAYTIDATSGTLTPVAGAPFATGVNPYGVAIAPSGKFAYVAGSSSNNVSAYAIDATSGALTPVAGSPFTAGNSPWGVAVDPSGKFVYVANASSNNISAYAIDVTTGALTPVVGSPFTTGAGPRGVTVDPSGKLVYVANADANNVSAFVRDPSSGALTPVAGSPFAAGGFPTVVAVTPTCLPPPTGMVAWWPADGNADDIIGANNGTLMNGAGFGPGKVGQALNLDGVDDLVETPARNWGFSTSATVTAWIKTTAPGPQAVFSLGHDFVEDEMLLYVSNGNIAIFNHKSPGNYSVRVSTAAVNTGDWVFVAGILDGGGSTSNLRIFVNGVEEAGAAFSGGSPTDIVDSTPRSVRIGRRTTAVATEIFEGEIDEVQLYNRALTAGEIAAIFNAGSAGNCRLAPTAVGLAASPNPSTFGEMVTVTATVTSGDGTPSGSVTFYDGAASLGVGALDGSGQASFSAAALSGGSHSFTAAYEGDASFAASISDALTQTVNAAATTVALTSDIALTTYGQPVTFTAVSSAAGTPTGTVSFMDGAAVLGDAVLSGGQAAFRTPSLSAGSHSITAVYAGDGNFEASTSAGVTQTVSAAATTTVVGSSLNPSTYGQAVTLTATVTSAFAVPVGAVTFRMGSTVLATEALDSSGQASFTTSALDGGSSPITAAYSGNSNFLASSSSVTQKVSKAATATVLTSSLNPSQVGQAVTFPVTVTSEAGTPTGKVTFKDGTKNLGSVTLAGGQATFATSALKKGSHTITAAYGGSADFASSSSSTVQTVQ